MIRRFTPSRDGKLRTTFRLEIRLTEEEIAALIDYDARCHDGERRSIEKLLHAVFWMGERDFWTQGPRDPDEE